MTDPTFSSPLDSLGWSGNAPGMIQQQHPIHAIEKLVIKGGNVRVEIYRGQAPYMAVAAQSKQVLDAIDIKLTKSKLTVGSGLVFSLSGGNLDVYAPVKTVDGKGNVTMSVGGNRGIMILGGRDAVQVFQGGVGQVINGDMVNGGIGPYVIGLVLPVVPQVKIKGAGDVLLADVDQETLCLAVEGSGGIEAEGKVRSLEIQVAGSGDVDARDLIASGIEVQIAGSGDVQAHATESACVSIAGSGDVVIRGNPARRSKSVAGSGRIKFK